MEYTMIWIQRYILNQSKYNDNNNIKLYTMCITGEREGKKRRDMHSLVSEGDLINKHCLVCLFLVFLFFFINCYIHQAINFLHFYGLNVHSILNFRLFCYRIALFQLDNISYCTPTLLLIPVYCTLDYVWKTKYVKLMYDGTKKTMMGARFRAMVFN